MMTDFLIKLIPYAAIAFCLYAGIRTVKTREFGMRAYGYHEIAKGKSAVFFGICLILFAIFVISALLFNIDPFSNPYLQ